jgi:hypothetical protein
MVKPKIKFKSGRGSYRGGGRPKGSTISPQLKRESLTNFRLPKWIIDWIKSQERSGGRVIEEALIKHYRLKQHVSESGKKPIKKRIRG